MRSFKPYPNERDSVKQTREKRNKPCNFDQKIPMKILSHYPLVLPSKKNSQSSNVLQNLFPPKGSLVNAPQKKKIGGKKSKRGGEERKQKVKDETISKFCFCACPNFETVIWHQEQKLVQCSTCKQRFGQFGFFLARQRPAT